MYVSVFVLHVYASVYTYIKEGCYIVHPTPSSGTVTTDGYIDGFAEWWQRWVGGYVCRVAEG